MELGGIRIRTTVPMRADQMGGDVYTAFEADKALLAIPVVDDENRPIGVLNRSEVFTKLATRFGQDVFAHKPIIELMNEQPLLAPVHSSVEDLVQLLGEEADMSALEGFILIDDEGRYAGTADGLDIMRALATVEANRAESFRSHAEELEALNETLAEEVREREAAERRASELANSDTLTGLANRRRFLVELADHVDSKRPASMIFIDLDRFKQINDQHNHLVGDAVLMAVSGRLRLLVRDGLAARLGGDEFAVLLPGETTDWELQNIANRIRTDLLKPIVVEGMSFSVGASLGCARFPEDGEDTSSLMMAADLAMFRAKREGGGVRMFDAKRDAAKTDNSEMQEKFGVDVANWRVEPAFQPIFDLASGQVTGYEALARWPAGREAGIGPDVFIGWAESMGIVDNLFWSILSKACKKINTDDPGKTLAVNVSPMQFTDPAFPKKVLNFIERHDFPLRQLELEVTESVMINDLSTTTAALQELAEAGVSIALDDFGTGYSSLSLLQTLPLTKVKIDRSFVNCLSEKPQNASIVASILSMCDALGLRTCAEGVEDQRTLSYLGERLCNLAQGYLIGKPEMALPARQPDVAWAS